MDQLFTKTKEGSKHLFCLSKANSSKPNVNAFEVLQDTALSSKTCSYTTYVGLPVLLLVIRDYGESYSGYQPGLRAR